VAPSEAHNAVLCERFDRCLNKAQRIGAADAQTFEKWAMNCLFAACAWNDSQVDGTDVIRSFAAKARTFHFPLHVQTDNEIARTPQQGEATMQHVETMFPLWFRQKELLKTLINGRRTELREMADQNKTKRTFETGDTALVQKQVTSSAKEGKPAKLTVKARGPCRVLEEARKNACYIQQLSAEQSLTNSRKTNERTGNENGETPIIVGHTQKGSNFGHQVSRNGRRLRIQSIGQKFGIL
jgi:hypothetical protein